MAHDTKKRAEMEMAGKNFCRTLSQPRARKLDNWIWAFLAKMCYKPPMTNQSPPNGRYAAIETLNRLFRTRYPVTSLFEKVAEECRLPGAERRLAMNLVYGVLRHRLYLEGLLGRLSHHPLTKFDPFVRQALAVGLYQLFCLDRIPESAAVNETVKAIRTARLPKRLQGFVNGILREAIRQRAALPGPETPDPDGLKPLNHPEWLTSRWQQNFGREEMIRICLANNREPQLVLRTNTCHLDRDALMAMFRQQGLIAEPGHYAPDAVSLPGFQGSITSLPGYAEGYFQIQDEAAQLASLLLAPFTADGHYLDACAGLGGKTSHLLQLIADSGGHLVALEPEFQRQRLFTENINRLFPGKSVSLVKDKLQAYRRICPTTFNGILVDAPCSGTGVIGRHPDIRWNRMAEELPRYQQDQLDLLVCAAELLQAGGLLVYATCSIEPEENQQVIARFLDQMPDFILTDCAAHLPQAARNFVRDGCFCPHPDQTIDGFFAARLQRLS